MEQWSQVVKNIEDVTARMFFKNIVKNVNISGDSLILSFSNESFAERANDPLRLKILQQAILKTLGKNFDIKIAVGDNINFKYSVSDKNNSGNANIPEDAKTLQELKARGFSEDSNLNLILSMFQGKVLEEDFFSHV